MYKTVNPKVRNSYTCLGRKIIQIFLCSCAPLRTCLLNEYTDCTLSAGTPGGEGVDWLSALIWRRIINVVTHSEWDLATGLYCIILPRLFNYMHNVIKLISKKDQPLAAIVPFHQLDQCPPDDSGQPVKAKLVITRLKLIMLQLFRISMKNEVTL